MKMAATEASAMSNPETADRLSWGDSVFLNLERTGMPLNVAGISILEGKISFPEFVTFVESKLPLIPRYLMRVVTPPLNAALPTWDFDPAFDIRNHVREVTLKHGTNAELKALAGKILGHVIDREHPLWDMTLVHGLKGDRTALIARMHHCLADGIAGVGIMNVFMDASPTPAPPVKRKTRLRVPRGRDPMSSLVDGLASSYSSLMERVLSTWAEVLNFTERTLGSSGSPDGEEVAELLPELTAPTQRLRFNVIYRGPQKFACTEIPLDDVKGIRQARGTSVNDVLLTLVAATIRRYAEFHGDRLKGRFIRIMVPVNLRGNSETAGVGNHISLVAVTIPLDIRDPRKLLAAVHRRTEFLKRTHAAELIGLTAGLLGVLPNALQALAGPYISRLPITPFNMVCTSVPGPQSPLYLLGHKMLGWYPYVPVGGELALNCAILSYDGMVYFGFSGDAHAAPDLNRLEKLLQENFTELCEAAGIRAPKKRSSRPHHRRVSKDALMSAAASQAPEEPASTDHEQPMPIPSRARKTETTPTDRSTAKEETVVLQQTA
jgi:diacylglycerol O-acyltransferase / wax synthase